MTKPTGIDESYGFADPEVLRRNGVLVASLYLSYDPGKNANPAKIKALHQAGRGVLLNWEALSGAPLNGAGQGNRDAPAAVAQVEALFAGVGYRPASRLCIPFSCDTDVNPNQYPTIDAYYGATKAVVNAAGIGNGVYGEADLIEHLHALGLTEMEWQSAAWSYGRLSPEADYYQFLNTQTMGGAAVDYDTVEHVASLGAWWPPGHPYDRPADQPAQSKEDDVVIVKDKQTSARYVLIPGRPALRVSKIGARHYAQLFGIQVTEAEHNVLVHWDARMRAQSGTHHPTHVEAKKK